MSVINLHKMSTLAGQNQYYITSEIFVKLIFFQCGILLNITLLNVPIVKYVWEILTWNTWCVDSYWKFWILATKFVIFYLFNSSFNNKKIMS